MSYQSRNIGALVSLIVAALKNATSETITSAAIDRQNFGSCVLAHAAGAAAGAPTAVAVTTKLQHSDTTTSGDFVDFDPSITAPALDAESETGRVDVDLSSAKRYIRTVTVVTLTGGTSPTLPVKTDVVLGGTVQSL